MIHPLDQMFVERLKIEISDRCSTFVKLLIAIVKGVATRDDFDKRKMGVKFNCLQVNAYECYMVLQVISYRFSVPETKKL